MTFPSARIDTQRWHVIFVVCLVLTLFNLMGTRHTLARTTLLMIGIPYESPSSITMLVPIYSHGSSTTMTDAFRFATVNQSLHSENFRIDPTALQRHTQNLTMAQVWQEYGRFSDGLVPLYQNQSHNIPIASICNTSLGEGWEGRGGFQILRKVQIAAETTATNARATNNLNQPRLLCAIYTHPLLHQLARAAALTWGRRCDGFLALSNQTITTLQVLDVRHEGPESYHNMWQKTRSIWSYLHQHYRHDYDLFHLGGDDMYVIPENLKWKYAEVLSLSSLSDNNYNNRTATMPPIFMGQWIPHGHRSIYVGGGGGYTLNRPALEALVERALPGCHVNTTASYEDRLVTKCLAQIGISPSDTRDFETAEQTYHDHNPQSLFDTVAVPPDSPKRRRASFHAKSAAYWETLPHPSQPNTTVGPRTGVQAVAVHSVSFHKIHYPDYMVRLHVLLHPEMCPSTTAVARSLMP